MLNKGETHEELSKVFQIEKVYSVLKEGNDYKREEDKTHKEQLEHIGTPITDENSMDTDVVIDPKKRVSEPDIIQNLKKNIDHKYVGDNEL